MMLKDFIRPKWRHSDPRIRLEALKRGLDQATLIDMALSDPDLTVGKAALQHIESMDERVRIALAWASVKRRESRYALEVVELLDEPGCLRLALEADDEWDTMREIAPEYRHERGGIDPAIWEGEIYHDWRSAAFDRISGEEALAEIARRYHSSGPELEERAVGKITSKSLLADIARHALSYRARMVALSKVEDRDVLRTVAQHDKDSSIRKEAIRRLDDSADRDVLRAAAQHDKNEYIRIAAIQRLDDSADRDVLRAVAQHDKTMDVRIAAIQRIDDPGVLESLVETEDHDLAIIRAVQRITDQETLQRLAKHPAEMVRLATLVNLTDAAVLTNVLINAPKFHFWIELSGPLGRISESALADLVRRAHDAHIRHEALKRITNQDLLFSLVMNSNAHIDRLTDPRLLVRVALEGSHADLRLAALRKVSDQTLLLEITDRSQDLKIRMAAAFLIGDPAILKRIVEGNDDVNVKLVAVGRINNSSVLREIAASDQPLEVRYAAIKGISDHRYKFALAMSDSASDIASAVTDKMDEPKHLRCLVDRAPATAVQNEAKRRLLAMGQPVRILDFKIASRNSHPLSKLFEPPPDDPPNWYPPGEEWCWFERVGDMEHDRTKAHASWQLALSMNPSLEGRARIESKIRLRHNGRL